MENLDPCLLISSNVICYGVSKGTCIRCAWNLFVHVHIQVEGA